VTTAVRWTVIVLLVVHGLIHFLGVVKGFGWAEVGALTEPIGAGAAVVWSLASVLVLATAVMLVVRAPSWWWAVAAAAALVSQVAILTSWTDAKAGTAANVVLVLVAVFGFAAQGPTSFAAEWGDRAEAALQATPTPNGVVTEADLAGLPDPVSRYVRRCGAVGQPHVSNFFAEVHGRIRGGRDKPWMSFTARQLNTYGQTPQRLFYLEATMFGLPVTVFHVFDAEAATMRGKVVSLFPILDAKGPQMNRSETVTLFNDMVVFAPAALVDAPVRWTELSPTRVRAAYTRADETITADLIFDVAGDLVDFVSQDRSRASSDGTSFTLLPWNTPITAYANLNGHRVAVHGTAWWDAAAPEGHFSYIEFTVDDLAYNVTAPAIPAGSATGQPEAAAALPGAS
jgi:Family of unknown function (DUF6544)